MIDRPIAPVRTILPVLLALFAVTGCDRNQPQVDQSPDAIAPAPAEQQAAGTIPDGIRVDRLVNATIQLPLLPNTRIVLRDGSFIQQVPPIRVTLDEGSWTAADFDSDGQFEAAVLIQVSQGLSATPTLIPYLVLFGVGGSTLQQEATLQLPAGARVAGIRAVGVFVEIDLVEERPGDRRCCPTGRRTLRYRLNNGQFEAT